MSIRRAPRPTTGYTLIRDAVLRDTNLSYRARGVLASILSRPDNWTTSADQLATEGSEGRDAIRTALSELEAARYIERVLMQDGQGRWSTHTVVYDEPQPLKKGDFQEPETDYRTSVFRTSVSQASKKNNLEEQPKDIYAFEDFWSAYPKKVEKKAAEAKWKTVTKTVDPDLIRAGLVRYLDHIAATRTEPQYVKGPAVWLNKGCWEDVYPTSPAPTSLRVVRDTHVPDRDSLPWKA